MKDQPMIKLQCYDPVCMSDPDAFILMVYPEKYEPGKHKCKTCGCALQTEDERNEQFEQWKRNHFTSQTSTQKE